MAAACAFTVAGAFLSSGVSDTSGGALRLSCTVVRVVPVSRA